MKPLLNKLIDVSCFIAGPVLLAVNVVSFEASDYSDSAIYYPSDARFGIGLGIALIAFGILRIYWRKNN